MSLVSNQFHTFNAPELLEITSGTTFAQTQKKTIDWPEQSRQRVTSLPQRERLYREARVGCPTGI